MTIPLWALLGFGVWTILVLLAGVGVYRWGRILGGHAELTDFPGGAVQGPPFYRRAMRAHANCLETLPVFAAIVLIAAVAGVATPRFDQLAVAVLLGRIGQTLTHMVFPESNVTVGIRFTFFSVQLLALLWMAAIIALSAGSGPAH
jgi:uncharacterized MAPEG superfamily protein